jgi:hypothetical protein
MSVAKAAVIGLLSITLAGCFEGPQGPPGAKGDKGDQGTAGPAGPAGNSNFYVVKGTGNIACSQGGQVAAVTCQSGTGIITTGASSVGQCGGGSDVEGTVICAK